MKDVREYIPGIEGIVKRSLIRHAENWGDLDEEGRIVEDRAAYNFVDCIYIGNGKLIKKYKRMYDLLKRVIFNKIIFS